MTSPKRAVCIAMKSRNASGVPSLEVLYLLLLKGLDERRLPLTHASRLLAHGTPLTERLDKLISPAEIDALRTRVATLRGQGSFPEPSDDWPPLPWLCYSARRSSGSPTKTCRIVTG